MKTWEDLELAAIGLPWDESRDMTLITGEPVLRQALTMVEMGHLTREQALIQVIFWLIHVKNDQHKMILDYLNSTPARHVLPIQPWEDR